jgi:hypothetical protein
MARNTTTNWVTKSGLTDFARLTLTGPLNALPLVWSAFNILCESNGVTISWKTLQESNTSAFYIRRSANGSNWQTIATVAAAGNSNTAITYSFTDPLSFSGAVYRVVQEDRNGVQTISPVLYSKCDIGDAVSVYPNPAYSQCWVSVQSASSTTVTMRLYDSKGTLIKQQLEAVQGGSNQLSFQMNGLPQGIYNLVIGWGSGKLKTVKIEKR